MELREEDFQPATLDAAALAATHGRLEASPPGREDLAFSLMLPKNWEIDPATLVPHGNGSQWTPLAAFGSREFRAPVLVAVLWRKVEVEVSLEDWMAFEMAVLKVNVLSFRIGEDERGKVVDIGGTCIGVITAPGQAVDPGDAKSQMKGAVRVMARTDGQDAFLVWGMSEREAYPAVAEALAVAGATFRLKRGASATGMEAMQRVSGTAPGFELLAPASWTLQPIPDNVRSAGKSGLNLILAPSGSLDGFVRVKAIDTRVVTGLSMDKLVQDATEEMAEGSVTMTTNWQQDSDPGLPLTPDLEIGLVAGGGMQQAAYEIAFGVVQRPPLVFCVTAILVSAKTDALANLRGRRVYKLALATARPM
jgi:hypothetical protein